MLKRELPYEPEQVLEALTDAGRRVDGLKYVAVNPVKGTVVVKTKTTLMEFGETARFTVRPVGSSRSKLSYSDQNLAKWVADRAAASLRALPRSERAAPTGERSPGSTSAQEPVEGFDVSSGREWAQLAVGLGVVVALGWWLVSLVTDDSETPSTPPGRESPAQPRDDFEDSGGVDCDRLADWVADAYSEGRFTANEYDSWLLTVEQCRAG